MEEKKFAPMRRSAQQIEDAVAWKMLHEGEYMVLAVAGEYPYAVPLNYACEGGKLYFHCAAEGMKMDCIRKDPRVSLCVVGRHEVVKEQYTSFYESVIAFGTARELTDDDERYRAICLLNDKYCEGEQDPSCMTRPLPARVNLVEVTIEHITGKVCKEWK